MNKKLVSLFGFILGFGLSSLGMTYAAQAPTISFTAPPDGSTLAGSVSLGVNTGATTACVQYQVDNQVLGVSKTGPFGWTWDTIALHVTDGAHTLKAIAEDAAGIDSTPALRSVIVANGVINPPPPPPPADTEFPKVTLTSPTNGASFTTGSIQSFTATATDNVGVTALQFDVDGQPLGGPLPAPPYQAYWGATLGSHNVGATAKDAANNSTRAAVSVTVTTPPIIPTLTVSSVTQGNSGNFTLTAKLSQALSGLTVTFIITGPSSRTLSAPMTSGTATTQLKLKGYPTGIYTVQAITLVSGSTVTKSITFKY